MVRGNKIQNSEEEQRRKIHPRETEKCPWWVQRQDVEQENLAVFYTRELQTKPQIVLIFCKILHCASKSRRKWKVPKKQRKWQMRHNSVSFWPRFCGDGFLIAKAFLRNGLEEVAQTFIQSFLFSRSFSTSCTNSPPRRRASISAVLFGISETFCASYLGLQFGFNSVKRNGAWLWCVYQRMSSEAER